MRDPMVSLADLERVADIAPDMPARQVAEMMRWIAEIQEEQVLRRKLHDAQSPAPAETAPEDHPIFLQPDPVAPDRAGLPWEDYEVQIALDMIQKGATISTIAARLGRPVPATGKQLEKLRRGWRPRSVPKHPAPVTPPDPVVAPRPPKLSLVMTGAQRDLMARVMRLEDDFTPQDDLYLVEAILGRRPLDVIADQLGCDQAAVKARWQALLGFDPKVRKGGVPLDLQSDLVVVLRQLAGEAAA